MSASKNIDDRTVFIIKTLTRRVNITKLQLRMIAKEVSHIPNHVLAQQLIEKSLRNGLNYGTICTKYGVSLQNVRTIKKNMEEDE